VAAAKRRRRGLPSTRSLVTLLVVIAAAVALAIYVRQHRPPGPTGAGPGGSTAPGVLRATAMTGHVTGPVPRSCRQRTAGDGQPLPDPACTPGVVSAVVSQANLTVTICHSGYTSTVRPPESDTESFKKKIVVAYQEPGTLSDYELDHLVPLELGGSNDAGNLWPERNDHPAGAINSKDLVENALNKAVCTGRTTLAAAQAAIASDWTMALTRLGLPPLP
jgi:hypothetical protein